MTNGAVLPPPPSRNSDGADADAPSKRRKLELNMENLGADVDAFAQLQQAMDGIDGMLMCISEVVRE